MAWAVHCYGRAQGQEFAALYGMINAGEGMMHVDLRDSAIQADPYPTFARLRKTAPVTRIRLPFVGQGWLVTRYDDVRTVLTDPRLANDQRNAADSRRRAIEILIPDVFRLLQDSMVMSDEPRHRRLRAIVHQAFTPRMVEQMEQRITQIVDDLLERAARKPSVDLMAELALPLPITVISEMMGVAERDRLRFHRWTSKFLEAPSGGPLAMVLQLPNGYRMRSFFERLIAERRADPQADLVTALVEAEAGGDRLSQDELLGMIFLLLLAGHETTVNLIGNGVLALLDHPNQLALLRANPELIDSAVEELLRFTNPVQQPTFRYAREDFELGGQLIRRGDVLLPMLASANRDETVFANPDVLDITRSPNRHLAFGLGVHYCLGAPLARIEARIALGAVVQRYPNLRLATTPAELKWRGGPALRGLRSLPVQLA